uniref:Chaperone protein ClpB 2 n=1 Tax=Anthurium amnicola TaxID=1678845 RepID=A0A1D1YLY8_9ARAE
MFARFQGFWPFSLLKTDDLKVSNRLVHGLPVPEQTKQFIFAIREPSSQCVVYILAVQNLSKQSSLDAECLIKSIRPDAVVVQVAPSALPEILAEEKLSDIQADTIPTSTFGVLKKCFLDKINKEKYENVAGNLILREIFGIGFYGHFLAAKRAAEEVKSQFLLLESPYDNTCTLEPNGDAILENQSPLLSANSLLPRQVTTAVSLRRFNLTDGAQSKMVKSLTRSLGLTVSEPGSSDPICYQSVGDGEQRCNYEVPWFAHTVYSLLTDLHDIFFYLPAIGKALRYAQKMLADVNEGEPVDTQLVAEVHNFQIAVEGLRIALNSAARCHDSTKGNQKLPTVEFNELPPEEKCHALFAQGLKEQAKNFRSVVVMADAGSLSGLRRHWNTPLPPEVVEFAGQGITRYYDDENIEEMAECGDKRRTLTNKPVVAVGAGATAFLGAASLSKAIHASTFMKFFAYKFPVSLKFSLALFQRTVALGLSKILGPAKFLATGVASSGTKVSTLKAAATAEKIHAVAHSIIASAERTSLLAMRTSFYEIMRKRKVRPARVAPWATFGCSMTACVGLLAYGDGIECAAESVPSAPMIASLGRGLQSLHEASQQASQSNSKTIQEALQSLMYNLKKLKVQ